MTSLIEVPTVGDRPKPGAADLSTLKECRGLAPFDIEAFRD
jgi:hypothetical protein